MLQPSSHKAGALHTPSPAIIRPTAASAAISDPAPSTESGHNQMMLTIGQKKRANHRRARRGGGSGRGNSQNHPTEPKIHQRPADIAAPFLGGTTVVDMNNSTSQIYVCGHFGDETLKNTINILIDTMKIEPDQENPEKYHFKFSYDAHACGSIRLCISELSVGVKDMVPTVEERPAISESVKQGLNQIFIHEIDGATVSSLKHAIPGLYFLTITTQNATDKSTDLVYQKVVAVIEKVVGKIQIRVTTKLLFLNGERPMSLDESGICKAMSYKNDEDIGFGSNGTIVFNGKYDDKVIAVKRIPKAKGGDVDKQIQNVKAFDHPNIVRFYGQDEDECYVFIALEKCECTLSDLILGDSKEHFLEKLLKVAQCKVRVSEELLKLLWDLDPCCSRCKEHFSQNLLKILEVDKNKRHFSEDLLKILRDLKPCCDQCKGHLSGDLLKLLKCKGHLSEDLLKFLRGLVGGIAYLHERGVNRLKLKLQNVLIHQDISITAKLSNFSISETGIMSLGWQADMFALGILLFQVITHGKHPFGEDKEEIDQNIRNNNIKNMIMLDDMPEAKDLISSLLDHKPESRPKAAVVYNHPFFWDLKMCIDFFIDASNHVQYGYNDTNSNSIIKKSLNKMGQEVFGKSWNEKLDKTLQSKSKVYGYYDYSSLDHLLRLIRYRLLLPGIDVERVEWLMHFRCTFPGLLMAVYQVLKEHCGEGEYIHHTYFV